MNAWELHNIQVVKPGEAIFPGSIRVEEGVITQIRRGTAEGKPGDPVVDGGQGWVTPGMIDLHVHGMGPHVFADGPEALHRAAAELPRTGVTTALPTCMPQISEAGMSRLGALAEALDTTRGVYLPGLHLEGPFLGLAGAACGLKEGDPGLLDELLAAGCGRVRAMSIAPEVPGIVQIIERLVEQGVTPFITHTRASVEEAQAAIAAGARHATHFYDVFPVPPETDPGVRPVGVVEAVFAGPGTTCDFIADGVHVHPVAIRAAVAARGWAGVSLITDATFGAGRRPGRYDTPWGYPVVLAEGDAPRIDQPGHPLHGALAGSALTMDRGMRNLLSWLDLPPEQIWAMSTANPARVVGLKDRGRLEEGLPADLVLWNRTAGPLEVGATWSAGTLSYLNPKNHHVVWPHGDPLYA